MRSVARIGRSHDPPRFIMEAREPAPRRSVGQLVQRHWAASAGLPSSDTLPCGALQDGVDRPKMPRAAIRRISGDDSLEDFADRIVLLESRGHCQ